MPTFFSDLKETACHHTFHEEKSGFIHGESSFLRYQNNFIEMMIRWAREVLKDHDEAISTDLICACVSVL